MIALDECAQRHQAGEHGDAAVGCVVDHRHDLVRRQERWTVRVGLDGEVRPGEMALVRPAIGVVAVGTFELGRVRRSEEHTSELQSLMRISYAVFCLKKKNTK